MPFTNGFSSLEDRDAHFDKHRREFDAETEDEYERLADEFLGGPKPAAVLECTRSSGDLLRYCPLTQRFGILSADGHIVTFFKPKPSVHKLATNLKYFHAECLKDV